MSQTYRYHCPKCGMTNIDYGQAAQHLCKTTGHWEGFELTPISREEAERELGFKI